MSSIIQAWKRRAIMKLTVFNGSPKGARGNTHVMVEAFLEGFREAGSEGEQFFSSIRR